MSMSVQPNVTISNVKENSQEIREKYQKTMIKYEAIKTKRNFGVLWFICDIINLAPAGLAHATCQT